tara:strand:+ start:115 stop:426 length:312 start_codon:yes stop_codon:yes gene_type:complete
VSSFVLAVLLLNERDASNKAVEAKERAIKNYRGAERWFVTAISMASNEKEIVDGLKEIEKVEKRRWDKEWQSESNTKMSVEDQRNVDISMLGHLLKILSNKKA